MGYYNNLTKISILLITTMIVGCSVPGEYKMKPAHPITSFTTVEFEKKTYDFGTLFRKKTIKQVIRYKNTGTLPLHLLKIGGAQKFKIINLPYPILKPGKQDSVIIRISARRSRESQVFWVYLLMNTTPENHAIKIIGKIRENN